MPKRTQLRRGTTANHALFTGAVGELTIDTDKKVAVVHDGAEAGGYPLARADQALSVAENLGDLDDADEARENLDVYSKAEVQTLDRTRQRSNGLSFDGVTASQRIYCVLGNLTGNGQTIYNIGTDPFSLRIVFKVPETTGITRTIAMISTSNSAIAANGFAIVLSSGILEFRKYGATSSDFIFSQYAEGHHLEGEVIELLFVRNATGIAAYVNGVAVPLIGPSTFGAGATWTGTIASDSYLIFGNGIGTQYTGVLYALSLFNYALSATEAQALAIHGIPVSDTWANPETELILDSDDRDFSAAGNWANVDFLSFDTTADMTINATSALQKANLLSVNLGTFVTGRKYQINFSVANCAGAYFFKGDGGGLTFGTFSTNGNQHLTGVLEAASFGDLEIICSQSGGVDIDNIYLRQAGAILDLDFSLGGEYQVFDRSTNRKHATLVGSPVFLSLRRSGQIRVKLESSSDTQFLGGTCIPTNARISAIIAYPTEDTPTIFLGTSSGASDLVASVGPLTQNVRRNLTLAANFSTTGNIWVKSNSSGRIDFTVLYDLVD